MPQRRRSLVRRLAAATRPGLNRKITHRAHSATPPVEDAATGPMRKGRDGSVGCVRPARTVSKLNGVVDQLGNRHRPHASGNRGDRRCNFPRALEIHIPCQSRLGSIDSDVDHYCAGGDHVARYRMGPPDGRNQDLGAPSVSGDIGGSRVTNGYGCIGAGRFLHEERG